MSKLWEYWKCPNFGQTFGHIWDKCPYFGHIFCYILDKCLSFGHLFGNILDKFQHFRHILDTFWTGVQTLDRLWSQFGRMSLFWQHIGHILYTFWTHYVQIVSILTLFKGTGLSSFRWGMMTCPTLRNSQVTDREAEALHVFTSLQYYCFPYCFCLSSVGV